MSAVDKIRSFAEARCQDAEVVRDGIAYGDCRELLALLRMHETAFREITLGRGSFSRDPQTHADNCIEAMKLVAFAALRGDYEKDDTESEGS